MPPTKGFTETDVPNQSGKCFVVTGANTGLGYEVSRVLAARSAHVILACRDESRALEAMARIRTLTPKAELSFLPLDLADLDSIRKAAKLLSKESQIDALINNAGVMTPPLMRTKQGFELQFGVNHLGTFALTSLLIPRLAETGKARIVVTSSAAHFFARLNWNDLNAHKSYIRANRYASSKLANALFFFELDRRLRAAGIPITVAGCHPGITSTNLARYVKPLEFLRPVADIFLNDATRGAWPTLQAATTDIISGSYYGPIGLFGLRGNSGPARRAPWATNPTSAKRLWDVSIQLTGIDPKL